MAFVADKANCVGESPPLRSVCTPILKVLKFNRMMVLIFGQVQIARKAWHSQTALERGKGTAFGRAYTQDFGGGT
jgi:hypothetical protein